MEPQLQLEEALLRPMVETVEEEEQEVGLKRKKHVRSTKNDLHTLDSTVYHAKIITSSSNISSITTNDEENDELLLVNNAAHAIADEVHHPEEEEEEEATPVFEENWGEQQIRFHGEDESGTISTVEQHTVEYSNGFDVFVSEAATNLVHEEYDLTAKESSDTVNSNAKLLVSEKDQMDGEREFNNPSEKFETQQVPSQHHHHHHHYHHHQEGHTEFVDQVDVKEGVKSDVIEEIDFEEIDVEEIDVEETDYNVEEVVEKQNTHDLICPNCSSCITRTVILRRRPKLRKHIRRTRKPKPKVTHTTEVIAPVAPVTVAPAPEAATNPDIDVADTEAFRCLSCFSFFIRIGTSIFSRTKTEQVRTSQEVATSETTSTVTSQVLDQKQVEEDIGTSSQAVVNGATNTSSIVTTEYDAVTSVTEVMTSTSVTVTVGQRETWIDHSKEEVGEAAAEPPNFFINSLSPVNGIEAGEMKMDLSKESEYINGNGTENRALSWQKLQSSVTQRQKLLDAFRPSKQTEVDEVKIDIEKTTDDTVEKEEEVGFLVVVAPSPVSVVQETPGVTDEEQQSLLVRQTSNDFDILKSIVYGGLMESITSLGVVSSAVGAGASTLNIFVLALANLIGGLFVLAHNLKELRKETDETTTQADTEEEEGKRYFKLLGRRGRFPLHATIAVISYIIFGVVAPITYGFSFHVSNDRDYKLASVAAACLFGVFLLALAKAHVRSPPSSYGSYIKTVLEYLTLGAAASGISFLAGELLDKIMQQLGWLDSTSSVAGALMQSGSGWASY